MNGTKTLIAGLGLGALAMYLLDPDRGKGRRAFLAQKTMKLRRKSGEYLDAAERDARNRLIGFWNEAAAAFSPDDVSDDALAARIRAAMGRKVRHPGAIQVACSDGCVTLSGDVLADEVESLISCAQKVQGVQDVFDELNVHEEPGNVPALQGDGSVEEKLIRVKPGPALIAGAVGLGVLGLGMARRMMPKPKEALMPKPKGRPIVPSSDYFAMPAGS